MISQPTTTAKPLSALPPDILTDILTASITHPPTTCALSLLCPEWNLCNTHPHHRHHRNRHHSLEALLRKTRIDTYTVPLGHSPQSASVSTSFSHSAQEHASFCLPFLSDPRRYGRDNDNDTNHNNNNSNNNNHGCADLMDALLLLPAGGGGYYQRELVRQWANRSVVVVGQEVNWDVVGPLWREMGREEVRRMVVLRERKAVGLLPFEDDDVFPSSEGECDARVERERWMVFGVDGREKERLPFLSEGGGSEGREEEPRYLFQRVRALVVNCVPALADIEVVDLWMPPSTWGPVVGRNMVLLGKRLEYERRANWRVRWDAMERLESLFLDLRGYMMTGNRFLKVEDVLHLARSLQGKGLKLLVIAGLRSGERYHGPDPLRIEDVEEGVWDAPGEMWVSRKRGGDINWWLMFRDAVRPGGRLVFVNKQDENRLRLLRPDAGQRVRLGN